jgi:hypothetical protein
MQALKSTLSRLARKVPISNWIWFGLTLIITVLRHWDRLKTAGNPYAHVYPHGAGWASRQRSSSLASAVFGLLTRRKAFHCCRPPWVGLG